MYAMRGFCAEVGFLFFLSEAAGTVARLPARYREDPAGGGGGGVPAGGGGMLEGAFAVRVQR